MADSSFFTQATNFVNAISGGVDSRTLTFNLNMNLGKITGNNQMGPIIPIVLSYSPLNVDDIGFGIGVTLGVTRFGTTKDNQLFLSTGEQYMVQKTNDPLVYQKKLRNFDFGKSGNDFVVTHKTGDIEILKDIWRTQVINAAGHKLQMRPDYQNRLADIIDDSDNQLLTVDYTDEGKITFTFYPNSADETYTVVLSTDGGYLQSVTINAGDISPLVWTIGYVVTDNWRKWVNSLTLPTGLVESVTYITGSQGMKFPYNYPEQFTPYPYVSDYTQTPLGNQPAIRVDYQAFYEDENGKQNFNNYLGFGSEATYDENSDALYGLLDDYIYGTTETRVVNDVTTTVVRNYNTYHLQISETTQTNNSIVTKKTDYYAEEDVTFEKQLAIFQMPKQVTTTWSNSTTSDSYSETVTSEFDNGSDATTDGDGNPTKSTAADGTVTVWEYYPIKGENVDQSQGTGCPGSPNNFKRFIKSKTVTAPANSNNTVSSHRTVYMYDTFLHKGSDVSSLVLKKQETHHADSTKLQTIEFAYETTDKDLAGRLVSKTTTHHGAKDYAITEKYDRSVVDSAHYVINFQLITSDGTVKHSQIHSNNTGRLKSETDIQGNNTQYNYDALGRKIARTLNPGTSYENKMQYDYIINPDATDKIPVYAITTDALSNRKRYALDGGKRHLHMAVNDVDKDGVQPLDQVKWYMLQEQHYDEQGRKLKAAVYDYLLSSTTKDATSSSAAAPSESLVQNLTYDDFLQVKESGYSDNIVHLTTTDPINLTTTTQVYNTDGTSGALTITTHEKYTHNPIKVEVYEPTTGKPGVKGKLLSTSTRSYDGWNQLVSETVPSSIGDSTTKYSYDAWGRVTTTTLPDKKQILRKYADFSSGKLVTEIGLQLENNGAYTKQGSQTFDKLGRLTQKISADRTWKYSYTNASDQHPTTITRPDGVVETYTYIPELGDKVASVQAGAVTQNFTYDNTIGHITKASGSGENGSSYIDYTYYKSGLAKDRTVTSGTTHATASIDKYTVSGKVYSATDFNAVTEFYKPTQQITRDTYGRVTNQVDGKTSTDITWDSLGRLESWTVTDTSISSNNKSKTTLKYDSQGRETLRTITDNGDTNNALTISQTWYINHQVKTRTTKKGNNILRDETYVYNVRNQLTGYTVSGSDLPVDQTGMGITSQTYTYTDLGSIKTRATNYNVSSVRKKNTTTFYYENADPCQLKRLTNDNKFIGLPSEVQFSYDKAGRMTTDEKGRNRNYDELGRLILVSDKMKKNLIAYNYDAHNRMSCHITSSSAQSISHYYHGDTLSCMKNFDDLTSVRLVRSGSGQVVAQEHHGGDNNSVWLTGTDMMGSVLKVRNQGTEETYKYTPYGEKGVPDQLTKSEE